MRKKGFTLVELLVVIGIIALLISILLPAMGKARAAAGAIKCESNIRQLTMAMLSYVNENKGIFPADSDWRYSNTDGDRSARPFGYWGDESIWINAAARNLYGKSYYQMQQDANTTLPNASVGKPNVFICPTAGDPGPSSPTPGTVEVVNGYLQMYGFANPVTTPAVTPAADVAGITDSAGGGAVVGNVFTCYAINSKLNSTGVGSGRKIVKQGQLRDATIIALIVEKRINLSEIPTSVATTYGSPNGNDLLSRRVNRFKADWTYFTGRHNKGGYIGMADGHVQLFTMAELDLPPGFPTGTSNGDKNFDFNQTNKIIWDPFKTAKP